MSRLTKKEPNNLSCHHFRRCEYLRNGTPRVETLNKLGKLEVLEEALGCPLDKLIQVLCDWGFSDENNMGVQINGIVLNGDGSICFSAVNGDLYDLKDYQKTWWLRGER